MTPPPTFERGDLPRRSLLQLAGAGLAVGVATMVAPATVRAEGGDDARAARTVRRFMSVIESRDVAAIWNCFAGGGAVEFPFLGARFTDFASLDAGIGPLLAILDGLTYSDVLVERMAAPGSLVLRYHGEATVSVTGKAYHQTYITEAQVAGSKMLLWREYFDTAVLNAALTP